MTQKQAALTGMTEYQQRREGWEKGRQEQWELTRWLAWHHYSLSPFLKQKPRTPKDIVTFPWEDGGDKKLTKRQARKRAKVTDAERDALDAIMQDFYKRKYGGDPLN